jgi:hypothetical protein
VLNQAKEDFAAMMNAWKAGDMEVAKEAFAALQQDVKDIRTKITDAGLTPYFGTRPVEDLQAIKQAMESGDTQEAKKAFHTLMQDLRQIRRRHLIYYHRNEVLGGSPIQEEPGADNSSGSINVTA